MMERIFGIEETMSWCKLNAFKYRMRAGEKPTSTVEKDLKKENKVVTVAISEGVKDASGRYVCEVNKKSISVMMHFLCDSPQLSLVGYRRNVGINTPTRYT